MDEIWEKIHQSREWGKYPADDLIQMVMRHFKNHARNQTSVLEIGCGAGANLSFFINEGFQTFGIDGSETAIKKAQQRLNSLLATPALKVADFTSLPWDDQKFDLVVDYLAIYSNPIADIRNTVNEAWRVLKVGGFMFSRTWGRGTTGDDTGDLFEDGTSRNPTIGPCANHGVSHFFSQTELNELYSNFRNIELTKLTQEKVGETFKAVEWLIWAQK